MLHFIIEFLLMNRVDEILIAVTLHSKKIDKFVQEQRYKGAKIQLVKLEDPKTFGDALREVNQMHQLEEDFILVKGDVITNFDLSHALQFHRKMKKEMKDHTVILTKLFTRLPFSDPVRHSS